MSARALALASLLAVTVPVNPVTTWEWTRYGRRVELTVRRPFFFGYRASVWLCRFHPLPPAVAG